jgi:uncharacterized protein (TIGR03435 family)
MRSICGVFLFAVAAFGQPAQRPEFEVASIKPSAALGDMRFKIGIHIDGAQVRCTYLSLADYIRIAYRVKTYQISGPDWISTDRFDISAKLPEGATREQVPAMVKALLEDRFQIKLHRASKEFPVYGLTVGKGGPKMKESPIDPDAPPSSVNVTVDAGQGGTTVNLGNGSSMTLGETEMVAKKITMPVLADQLARFVDRPIVDMTDLNGAYDLTLQFQREDFLAMKIRTALSAGVEMPPGALRLIETSSDGALLTAVQALGLKLESKKAPLETLVVDSILKLPTEN